MAKASNRSGNVTKATVIVAMSSDTSLRRQESEVNLLKYIILDTFL